ncbi:selenocysteine synthase [Symmachiella dynata]|uniref:Selenocysteine synthase n=1 Tax=Symmachiella dynata TaxID=2527995 RepID=A0A517ZSA4_9PLAN|nr:aminotransferase class V-fold PLP-dependent enzyme [Symmachiella dynata]QDU45369.1 selenocysteine synthase [Symmachiella dynata]
MGIYEDLGVTPVINVTGAVTRLGGAPMPQPVLDAFVAAAGDCVSLEELQAAASRRIAAATGAEAGIVTAGAAAALTLGSAAMITGDDLGKMERLPHCDDFACAVLIAREQRSGYDHAVRASGARLVEVGFNEIVANAGVRRTEVWEYEAAITPQTVGIIYSFSPTSRPDLSELAAMAHRHKLPVLVDAAGELPPRVHLTSLIATGADLVAFSGGKAIRGPQSTGILAGRGDLIRAAALQFLDMDDHPELWDPPPELIDRDKLPGVPRHGFGRGYKVSKEEIVALLTALELFTSGAYDRWLEDDHRRLQIIADSLANAPCACRLHTSSNGESAPQLEIEIDESTLGKTAFDVCRELRAGSPRVFVGHGKLREGVLVIQPLHLTDDTATAVGAAIIHCLGGH